MFSIAYFGGYNPDYARVRIVIKGLSKNGVKVLECQSRHKNLFVRLFLISKKFLKIKNAVDILFVCEAGQAYVPLAWFLAKLTQKRLVFDAFISYYHGYRFENNKFGILFKIKTLYFYFLDKFACILSDLVFLDTEEHVEYFSRTFNIRKEKFKVILVGSDEDLYFPRPKSEENKLNIFLATSFFPLHGVKYVVESARVLQEKNIPVKYNIVGDGICRKEAEESSKKLGLKNINFYNSVSPYDLPLWMAKSDICLGQFGGTEQADMVIPIKVYDALAMRKPVVTGENRAIKKVFSEGEGIVFCRMKDPISLAEKLESLCVDVNKRREISEKGYKAFIERASSKVIGLKLKKILLQI